MNRQQTIAHRQLRLASPKQLAQLHLRDDVFGDEFDWDETTNQYEGESMANDMLGFMQEFGAE